MCYLLFYGTSLFALTHKVNLCSQLCSGYERRFKGLFPQSVVLVGIRDVCGSKIYSAEQKEYVLGGGAFNIKAETKRMKRFTHEHIQALINQHFTSTGDKFEAEVAKTVMFFSDGQPWIVNRLLHECIAIATKSNTHKIITTNDAHQVSKILLLITRQRQHKTSF